ncbi:MAG: ABC transporter permease [Alphaproteobacteria bacterium]|nr:ABC transporter permease [Alphaproteobacteria bacterium]
MLHFFWWRFISLLFSLAFASIVIFFILDTLPGDPAAFMLGLNATEETIGALREKLHLDVSAVRRYFIWIGSLLTGDFGMSHTYQVPVWELIKERIFVSFPLAFYALLLSIFIGFPLGVLAAQCNQTFLGTVIIGTNQLGVSVPEFWFAILLVFIFSILLSWFPSGGFPGWSEGFLPVMKSLFLPAVALSFSRLSVLARVVRFSLQEAMSQDYFRTALAKGVPRSRAIWYHALRNAIIPLISILGLQFSSLLAGAIVIENVFFLPGLGRLVFQAVTQRDLIVVRGVVMLITFAVIVVTFLVELSCAALDPRLRKRIC